MARGVTAFDGSALREARLVTPCPDHSHALTVACLARQVGTSKALILSYEHGRSSPSPQRLADLARAVGVPASALQRRGTPQLADLRTAHGLTLVELAAELGMATNTYRRIESSGVLPKRRPGTFWDLARALDVDCTQLHEAILQIPAVQERSRYAISTLKPVFRIALSPGPFQPLQDTSPHSQGLASSYGAASSTVSRVVNILLANLRQLAHQRAQLEAYRDFTAHTRPAAAYERELDVVSERIEQEIDSAPEILERYLVNPLPQACWHSLAKLYLAGPGGIDDAAVLDDNVTTLGKAFDSYLVRDTWDGLRLSDAGVLFFVDTLPYYRVIYAPPERVIRPEPHSYGWPSYHSRSAPHRRHRLRMAHVLGHDPRPHWDDGTWMKIRRG
ncbi:helix-turn-helix domain-containing protein [Streptomyces griseoincarnatus]|uniref:helix-turn-helix domain-containing protein n=1 Tax=Streptomyces sp. I4(2020) TaxID=2760981 RepID=UPI0018EE9587|nr:helix-turn-helix transcriptional regulator [Streptomyces sp. I4(2020)]MBJ6613936.1 helix-turn-helix transcriptional regulator [Streptomyces sp. I3(2020)]MBJ6630222.1 helix-turn-helix transcriptional regulator [Streptomyces sp. I4(2020)]